MQNKNYEPNGYSSLAYALYFIVRGFHIGILLIKLKLEIKFSLHFFHLRLCTLKYNTEY